MLTCDLDQATFDLILELQLQDVQNLAKGKRREGDATPDAELAIEMYQAELESLAGFASDRAICRSIARAVMLDGEAITEHAAVELQAVHDRDRVLAESNSSTAAVNVRGGPARGIAAPEMEMNDELISKLQTLYVDDGCSVVSEEVGESSAWGATRGANASAISKASSRSAAPPHRSCIACTGDFPFVDVARCPCSHEYCRHCITRLFQDAIVDESLFPPRCCRQPIPLGLNRIFLPSKLVGEFRAKEIEYGTPNRTYCHEPACATFVPPRFIQGDVATCVRCHSRTCVMCKGAFHDGDCPEDVATQQLLRVAANNGWQRCRSCRTMVELNTGCNHMICKCGAQFCYVCGAQWKTCQCPQWEETRLFDRAVDIVQRDLQRDAEPEVEHEVIVRFNNAEEDDDDDDDDDADQEEQENDVLADNIALFDGERDDEEVENETIAASLVSLAPERDNTALGGLPTNAFMASVNQMRQNLIDNHECTHESWKNRRGGLQCEECYDVMPLFIHECRTCHILACRRCRYNRL